MKALVFFDDQDARGGLRTPASHMVRVTFLAAPLAGGAAVEDEFEIDMSAEHYEQLAAQIKAWGDAGRRTGKPASASGRPGKISLREMGPQGAHNSEARRQWWQEQRDWLDSLGLVSRHDPSQPVYRNAQGSISYPEDVLKAINLREEGREAEAVAAVAKFRPALLAG